IGSAGIAGTAASAASATAANTAIASTTAAASAKVLAAAPLILAVKWSVVGIATGLLAVGVSERTAHFDRASDDANGTLVASAPEHNRSKPAPTPPGERAAIAGEIATTQGEGEASPNVPLPAKGDPSRSKPATGSAKPLVPASSVADVARPVERTNPTAAALP